MPSYHRLSPSSSASLIHCTDDSFDSLTAPPKTSARNDTTIVLSKAQKILFGVFLLPLVLYFICARSFDIDRGTPLVETRKAKISLETNHTQMITHTQPFQIPPPNECCPFAKQLYETRYGGALNYRCCTNRLETLKDLREELLPLQSFGKLQNASILLQGDSLAEQHFLGLLCFTWRYNSKDDDNDDNGLKTKLTLAHAKNPDQLQASGTIWQATIQPFNITIQFLRWDRVQVCPTEGYQADFVILGGWHHDEPKDVVTAMGPFLKKIQALRAKRQHTTILSEALPAHFPGGEFLRNNPEGYPKPKVSPNSTKYYPKNQNGTYIHHAPVCDSSTDRGTPDVNQKMKTWKNQYNVTILSSFDSYRNRGDAHIGMIPKEGDFVGPKGRDCLHWCVEALDTWALQTWSLLVSLRQ